MENEPNAQQINRQPVTGQSQQIHTVPAAQQAQPQPAQAVPVQQPQAPMSASAAPTAAPVAPAIVPQGGQPAESDVESSQQPQQPTVANNDMMQRLLEQNAQLIEQNAAMMRQLQIADKQRYTLQQTVGQQVMTGQRYGIRSDAPMQAAPSPVGQQMQPQPYTPLKDLDFTPDGFQRIVK